MPEKPKKLPPKEPTPLSPCPSWEELKANPEFKEWHGSPFLRMMTAALRENFPTSGATDPHVMINHGGQITGWLSALGVINSFCDVKQEGEKEAAKSIPYQHHHTHED
jgi:hypothetical protein